MLCPSALLMVPGLLLTPGAAPGTEHPLPLPRLPPSMYASSWFLTLFLTTFPLPVATHVSLTSSCTVRTLLLSWAALDGVAQVPTGNDPRAQEGLSGPLESRTQRCTASSAFAGPGDLIFRVGLALLQVNQAD